MGIMLTTTRVKIDLSQRRVGFFRPFTHRSEARKLAGKLSGELAGRCLESDLFLNVREKGLFQVNGMRRTIDDTTLMYVYPGSDVKLADAAYPLNVPGIGNIPLLLSRSGVTEMDILAGTSRADIEKVLFTLIKDNLTVTWKKFQREWRQLEFNKVNKHKNSLNFYSRAVDLLRNSFLSPSMAAHFVYGNTEFIFMDPDEVKAGVNLIIRKDSLGKDYPYYRMDTGDEPDVARENASSLINVFHSTDKILNIFNKLKSLYTRGYDRSMQ
jgi:hypothetical protein